MTRAMMVLRYAANSLVAVFAILGSGFILGTILADPGGLRAILISVCWLVPMVVLALYAVRQPDRATKPLAILAALVTSFVLLDQIFGVVSRDDLGPVGSIGIFATAVALGFLGMRRPVPAGGLLFLAGLANLLGGILGTMFRSDAVPTGAALGGSSGAVAILVLFIGLLFLTSGLGELVNDRPQTLVNHPTHRTHPIH